MKLQFIEAGEIVTTHGVRGEVKVLPWGDSPDFLLDFRRVRIEGKDYSVQSCRIQKTCNLLKLKEIETLEQAQAMRGRIVQIHREDVQEDVIFVAELIGMRVICDQQEIGILTDVLDYPGNKVYVVQGEHSYMIPAVKQFILNTDMQANTMRVALIEGMRTDES